MKTKENSEGIEREMRGIVRRARKAFLGTLDVEGAGPYVSLAAVASDMQCMPLLLLSNLARHTRNIVQDDRASLLFDATAEDGDPLEGARVTLTGRIVKETGETAGTRFLFHHAEAANYAGFGDFAFYRLEVSNAHFVGGFGRIHTLDASAFLLDASRAAAFRDAEPGILSHMNADHADAVALYATRLIGEVDGRWRMCALDPEGFNLKLGNAVRRFDFPEPLGEPGDARHGLATLARTARNL